VEIYTRDLRLLLKIENFPELLTKIKKSKQKFEITDEEKNSLRIEHVQCEQFQKNTLNCITVLEPLSIVLHWKFSIKIMNQKSETNIIFKDIQVNEKIEFLAPFKRLLKGSLMINGRKNTRKWDKKNFEFKTKCIDIYLGPPKELSDIVVIIESLNGYFM
jgi:hypothetical protein